MLAERVKTWTEEWKQQGMHQGEAKMLRLLLERRYDPVPSFRRISVEDIPKIQTGQGRCVM